MATITITLPDELYQRLLAAAPPNDLTGFCLTALQEAIDRRSTLQAAPRVQRATGRPLKGDRVNITVYLERRFVVALDALAAKAGTSRADAINSVLENAVQVGFLQVPSDV